MKDNDYRNWDGITWAKRLRGKPELAEICDWGKFTTEDWLYLLDHCPNNDEFIKHCDKWEFFPIDIVCDILLSRHPHLIAFCPDSVWRKLCLGHWAKLICSESDNNAIVEKMKELGVATNIENGHGVMIGGFEWCCPFHWAEEYGSVFVKITIAAANPRAHDQKVRLIAERSVINPHGSIRGRYHSDILKHIQWLAVMAADFAKMAAEAAKAIPESGYAEKYDIIAEAAAYEIKLLTEK